jgi:hypothetical protein
MCKRVFRTSALLFAMLCLFATTIFAQSYASSYAYLCPSIDGKCDARYWKDALSIDFPYGKLMLKNNYHYLYILIDVTEDTYEDQIIKKPMCEDYFELYFDWDGNGKLTNNIDRVYSMCNMSKRLVYRYLIKKDAYSSVYFSAGTAIAGFGSSPNEAKAHRYYELRIPLSEVKMDRMQSLHLAFRVYSKKPAIDYQSSRDLSGDMSDYINIKLAFPPRQINLDYTVGSRKMLANQLEFEMDVAPYIFQKRTFLPIRYVVEPFGGFFEWNSTSQQLVIFIQSKIVTMTINSPVAYINGKEIMVDSGNKAITPQWKPPGRVMVPLRFVAETIGCEVFWDARTQKTTVRFNRD